MRRSAPTLVAALAIGSVLASAGPAAADGPLVPGETRTIRLSVPATWADALQVDVTVASLTQLENDCLDPEDEAGDDCSSSVGELADQLTGSMTLGVVGPGGCEPVATSGDLDLFGRRTTRLTAARPGVDCLFLELTFPDDDDADNLAQSDSLTFALDLVARDLLAGPDGQVDTGERPGIPDGDGRAPVDAARDPSQGAGADPDANSGTATAPLAADPAGGREPGADAVAPTGSVVEQAPAGPVLDRVEAQISVGGDGVVVQTRAADTSLQGRVLAWGSLLLGAIALGWAAFVLVRRRRRKKVVA